MSTHIEHTPSSQSVIYDTGCTEDGVKLIGGIWKLWEQEGFPLEMSHIVCRAKGWCVDWIEAMADASTTNNCPALMTKIEAFLPSDAIAHLKLGLMCVLNSGKTCDQIVTEKRANGRMLEEAIHAALTSATTPMEQSKGAHD